MTCHSASNVDAVSQTIFQTAAASLRKLAGYKTRDQLSIHMTVIITMTGEVRIAEVFKMALRAWHFHCFRYDVAA